MIYRVLLLLAMVVSPCSLSAQLSLREYIDMVREYSHALASSEAATEAATADMQIARKQLLPSLDMGAEANYDMRDGEHLDWLVRADITQPIYLGGGLQARQRQAEMVLNATRSNAEVVYRDVLYSAKVAYWQLSRAEIYYRAIERYCSIVGSLRQVVERRFMEGYTAKGDLLQLESRMSDAEYQLSRAEQQRLQALHGFNLLRGADPMCDARLSESILDTIYAPVRKDINEVVCSHPDYVASVAGREAARYGVKVVEARYLPSVRLNLYGLMIPKGAQRDVGVDGGVGISLTAPIFHFAERREAVRSAESSLEQRAIVVDEIVDKISLDESNSWTNILSTQSRVRAVQRSLDIALENLEMSTYSYSEGMATILDVLQAQISWLQIYSNAISAQYDYAVAVAAYSYVVGE